MTAEEIAKIIVDSNLQVQVNKEIRNYEFTIAKEMVKSGCKQVRLREKFGVTKGTVYWARIHGTKHPHKTYRQ